MSDPQPASLEQPIPDNAASGDMDDRAAPKSRRGRRA